MLTNQTQSLITSNIAFARSLARQFYRQYLFSRLEQEDLEGVAMMGLCEAAQRFDSEVGSRFRTFAYLRIRGAMFDYLRRLGREQRGMAIECVKNEEVYEENQTDEDLDSELASLAQISSELGIATFPTQGRRLPQISYADEVDQERVRVRENLLGRIRELVEELSEDQQTVFHAYYVEHLTCREISSDLGTVSPSWVARKRLQVLSSLKSSLREVRV